MTRCYGPASVIVPARSVLAIGVLFALVTVACSKTEEPPPEPPPASDAPAAEEKPKEPPLPARRFLTVDGDVTIDGQPAKVNTEVGATATIKTEKGAKAVITLGPDSVVQIHPGTSVTIGKSERKEISVKLALGALWSILPSGSSYEVVTENAVAGVRGTSFFVEAPAKKPTYVCACDGEVELTGINKKKPVVKAVKSDNAHVGFNVKGGKKAKFSKAKRHGHTDDEAKTLVALMPQTQPPAEVKEEPAPVPSAPAEGEEAK